KIMSNIESISLGEQSTAAVTKTGDLYMWGRNYTGQLGDGTTNDSLKPKKIMSNVKYVCITLSAFGHIFTSAITKNNELYMWGSQYLSEAFDPKDKFSSKSPKYIMSNVLSVKSNAVSNFALKTTGELYTWGPSLVEDGNYNYIFPPVKVIDHVLDYDLGFGNRGAVTKSKELYMWGGNESGQLGDGTTNNSLKPKKIMSSVECLSTDSGDVSAAIKESGDMYLWGLNMSGQIGDGTTTNRLTPTYIMNVKNGNVAKSNTIKSESTTKPSLAGSVIPEKTESNSYLKTKSFSKLVPDTIYDFYILKDKDSETPLSSENVLYISQEISDSEGNLSFTYSIADENGDINDDIADKEGFVVIYKDPKSYNLSYKIGDTDCDEEITDQDAIYLLFNYYFPDKYPVEQPCDFNKDGEVTDQDAIYLLFYVYFPEKYPI
ncbi:MAG: hypothetical protein IKF53_03545, partial [Clostridia bacterium]|nr:hypothetical protein [Clostridia bacterium]